MTKPYEFDQVLYRVSVPYLGYQILCIERFRVVKVTREGAWIAREADVLAERDVVCEQDEPLEQLSRVKTYSGPKKWVSNGTRYASPSESEARVRALYRAAANVRHCERRLRIAEKKLLVLEEAGVHPYDEDTPSLRLAGGAR